MRRSLRSEISNHMEFYQKIGPIRLFNQHVVCITRALDVANVGISAKISGCTVPR